MYMQAVQAEDEAEKLKEKNVAVVEYRVEPEAEEYRISRRIAEKREQKQNIAGGEYGVEVVGDSPDDFT